MLEGVEELILLGCLNEPDKIKMIPYDLFDKFKSFLLSEERYEDLTNLDKIKHKIVKSSYKEIIQGSLEHE